MLDTRSKRVSEGLKQMADLYRHFYNLGLEYQLNSCIGTYDTNNEFLKNPKVRFLTGTQVSDFLRKERKTSPEAKNFDSGIVKKAAFNAAEAYLKFWKYKIPKFSSRNRGKLSFKLERIEVFDDAVKIPKFGKIKLCEKGYLPIRDDLTNINFSYDGKHWWLTVQAFEEDKKETNLSGFLVIDFDNDGSLRAYTNERIVTADNLTSLDAYKRIKLRHKRHIQKFKRQARHNTVYVRTDGKPVYNMSKNMLKEKDLITNLSHRLDLIRRDHFCKIANTLKGYKPAKVFVLSNNFIGALRNGYLSRYQRIEGSLQLFNKIKKELEAIGSEIVICQNPEEFPACPQNKGIKACGECEHKSSSKLKSSLKV